MNNVEVSIYKLKFRGCCLFSKAQSGSAEKSWNLLNHKIYILSQKRVPELALNCLMIIIIYYLLINMIYILP